MMIRVMHRCMMHRAMMHRMVMHRVMYWMMHGMVILRARETA